MAIGKTAPAPVKNDSKELAALKNAENDWFDGKLNDAEFLSRREKINPVRFSSAFFLSCIEHQRGVLGEQTSRRKMEKSELGMDKKTVRLSADVQPVDTLKKEIKK